MHVSRFDPKCPMVMPRPIDDPRPKKYGVAISLDGTYLKAKITTQKTVR